jgi:uncharacterized membrane protein YfcA
LSPSDYATLAGLSVIAFGGAFVFGVTGFGAALLTIPLATHLVSLPFALAMFSLLDCTSAWRVALADPKNAVSAEWKRMLPMVVTGTVLGMTMLVNLPKQVTLGALGVFVLVVAVSNLVRAGSVAIVRQPWAYAAGLMGGITSALFGAGGPPYAIYLSRRPLSKEQYRATLGICTMSSISFRVIVFTIAGPLQSSTPWLWALAALPASIAGLWVAAKVFSRISRDFLMRTIGVMLIASGCSLIVRAMS